MASTCTFLGGRRGGEGVEGRGGGGEGVEGRVGVWRGGEGCGGVSNADKLKTDLLSAADTSCCDLT